MVILVLEHSATHSAKYAVAPIPPNMQLIGTPQAMEPETFICRGSFLAINNIAFSAHSEFKVKLFLLRT